MEMIAFLCRYCATTGDMEKMHGKRNERCWHDVGDSRQESSGMCGGCLSVAYTLTGVRGNDDCATGPKNRHGVKVTRPRLRLTRNVPGLYV